VLDFLESLIARKPEAFDLAPGTAIRRAKFRVLQVRIVIRFTLTEGPKADTVWLLSIDPQADDSTI
jgi:hypothetical protein